MDLSTIILDPRIMDCPCLPHLYLQPIPTTVVTCVWQVSVWQNTVLAIGLKWHQNLKLVHHTYFWPFTLYAKLINCVTDNVHNNVHSYYWIKRNQLALMQWYYWTRLISKHKTGIWDWSTVQKQWHITPAGSILCTWSLTLSFQLVETLGTGMRVAIHWHAASNEPVVLLLNLCDVHGIVTQSLLNLPNGLHFGTVKLLIKFDARSLY